MENCVESASVRCQGFSTSPRSRLTLREHRVLQYNSSAQVPVILCFTWLSVKIPVVLCTWVRTGNSSGFLQVMNWESVVSVPGELLSFSLMLEQPFIIV